MRNRVPIDRELVERCRLIPTSTWSDALDELGLSGVLPGLEWRGGRPPVAGPTLTVTQVVGPLGSAAAEEFGIDLVLGPAVPGQVVLIQQAGGPAASAIGGLAALAAQRHGVVAVLVDGACRDVGEIEQVGLPVLSREITPLSGRGRVRITGLNVPLRFGAVEVQPGDLAVADETGVVVVPSARLVETLEAAEQRAHHDAAQADRIRAGRPDQR